jgi:hypothetical protein
MLTHYAFSHEARERSPPYPRDALSPNGTSLRRGLHGIGLRQSYLQSIISWVQKKSSEKSNLKTEKQVPFIPDN